MVDGIVGRVALVGSVVPYVGSVVFVGSECNSSNENDQKMWYVTASFRILQDTSYY